MGSATVSGSGAVSSIGIDSNDARRYTVNLSGVADGSRINISLNNLRDSADHYTNQVSVSMDVLAADLTSDGRVNMGDANQVRQHNGVATNASNCRFDLNRDGRINVADVNFAEARAGNAMR